MDESHLPAASWVVLRQRAAMLRSLRAFFHERGFLEVETPVLSSDCVVDRHLDPLATTLYGDPRLPDRGPRFWLQTSPEFHMKRLLAAGGEAIFQVARVFRAGESGARHNPEFTLVEWYRRGATYAEGRLFLAELCQALLNCGTAVEVTYRAAFERALGVNPHRASVANLAAAASAAGLTPPDSFATADRDAWLDWLLGERVEPSFNPRQPTVLYDYPASQAALAQLRAEDDYQVAERFELYWGGVELANGYHELRDPAVLRERNRIANAQRVAAGKQPLPESSRLLAAMERGLPACTGCALGFDRCVMLATGASSLHEVLAFPSDRA